ncbi:fasciclin-like arabinogalactan protein 14 [Curcuma longa]|uniref:fasciclin-like arabinogalactan protein 14 n=1 Tax=Curcuma longa TaxID=136217 RepID=UPI003D9F3808
MASAAVLLLTAFLFSSSAAVDVMEILRLEPDFSTFTEFLDKTKVAQDISSLHTATVLALDNDAMTAVTALPPAVARELLSLHVILDYYDPDTLDRDFKKDKTAILPTLLQVTGHGGVSVDSFLNYTERADQSMYFGSTAPGAAHDSELIKVVGARPYDLSVLHISKAILSPSIVRGSTGAPSSVLAAPVVVDGDGSSVAQGPVASSGDSEVSGIAASPAASTPAQAPASAAERVMVGAALGLGVAVAVAVGL